MNKLKKLGKTIRRLRLEDDVTQQRMARMVGVHYTLLGHIERGTKLPSLDTLVKIAKAMRLPAHEILRQAGI